MNDEANQNKKAWDQIAEAYQSSVIILLDDVHYGPLCAGERQLRILGSVDGKDVLEIGCGGGQNTIVLAKWGAIAEGIDFSETQIQHARKLASRVGVNPVFHVIDICHLNSFPDSSKDIVLSAFSLEYVRSLEGVFRQIARILRPSGIFVFSELHPFVSGGDVLNVLSNEYWHELDYFDRRPIEFEWEFPAGVKGQLFRIHRTLEDYVRFLTHAGLTIEEVREPPFLTKSELTSLGCPYLDESLLEERIVWDRVPYTIIFKARKVG